MDKELSLVEHLEELRRRLIICLVAVFICGVFCYFYIDKILFILSKPVGKFVFLKPTEAFVTKLKLSLYCGIFVSLPITIYQIWKFVNPGLIEIERHTLYWVIPLSYLLFIFGVIFAFLGVLPTAMKFLLNYGTENIQPMISV
ncbi:MAG: twin-arginine translocase subunit TatC, partial [Endomicrobiia bacterium]